MIISLTPNAVKRSPDRLTTGAGVMIVVVVLMQLTSGQKQTFRVCVGNRFTNNSEDSEEELLQQAGTTGIGLVISPTLNKSSLESYPRWMNVYPDIYQSVVNAKCTSVQFSRNKRGPALVLSVVQDLFPSQSIVILTSILTVSDRKSPQRIQQRITSYDHPMGRCALLPCQRNLKSRLPQEKMYTG